MLINLFDTMPSQKEIDEALNKKFISKDKFAEDVERLVLKTQLLTSLHPFFKLGFK